MMDYEPSEFAKARRRKRYAYYVGCWLAVVFWTSLAVAVIANFNPAIIGR